MSEKPLTSKEQKVIEVFDAARPGLGAMIEKSIRHDTTGTADIIASMDEADIKVTESTASNTFIYRRIGG
ncbi:MAG: hypothetical protein KME31_30540 [Tolypothrix carrinoi HA7290-LM1]|jgi:hypothetical protein|nr:hypothetical protein [Tolypothrix carrinoi HA7290-LM1]